MSRPITFLMFAFAALTLHCTFSSNFFLRCAVAQDEARELDPAEVLQRQLWVADQIINVCHQQKLAHALMIWDDQARFFELDQAVFDSGAVRIEAAVRASLTECRDEMERKLKTWMPDDAIRTTVRINNHDVTVDGEEAEPSYSYFTIQSLSRNFSVNANIGTMPRHVMLAAGNFDDDDVWTELHSDIDAQKVDAYFDYVIARKRENVMRATMAALDSFLELNEDQVPPMNELLASRISISNRSSMTMNVNNQKRALPDEPPEFLSEVQATKWETWKKSPGISLLSKAP